MLPAYAAGRSPLTRRFGPCRNVFGVEPHTLFAVQKRPILPALVTLFQNRPAQEWKFLQMNSVSPGQGQIGPHREHRTLPVRRDAFKRKDPAPHRVAESPEDKLHLWVLHENLLLPAG